jgi:hypothetical protein
MMAEGNERRRVTQIIDLVDIQPYINRKDTTSVKQLTQLLMDENLEILSSSLIKYPSKKLHKSTEGRVLNLPPPLPLKVNSTISALRQNVASATTKA